MIETSLPECAVQIVEDDKSGRSDGEFKPLTSGQLLLKTRRRSDQRRLLDGKNQEEEEDQDTSQECFLSKFLAGSMILFVCGFIYFAVVQRWLLRS
ncbi:hypothetical protein PHMEG_00026836 [Phytophthora megakarya]|uniref:Uncharacterized protein n=1 Tax=Phytophthora megakarya TaxID=4795 RepID=A0A225V8T5_9STRA|nr:hypothetical protein PHMEG_00026836 [Phytophthora megakarya]